MTEDHGRGDQIAIVGMACRFPGAANLSAFWRNLASGTESVTFFTDEELLAAGVTADLLRDPAYVRAGAALADLELFDAEFFDVTAREAELLDPQHRLFLEVAFRALEDAGHDPDRFDGDVGVFAGVGSSRYGWTNLRSDAALYDRVGELAIMAAANRDYAATRVSYKLNLRGPSLAVATACSSSLVATHLACESLRNGECDMALAGGSAVELPHRVGYLRVEGGIESSDGHCRAFDARADGTVWGSGAGVLALRRLDDAIADGDHVYAVIGGTAVNNDGSAKAGFTAPSIQGQAEVIAQALAVAGVEPADITYVEAHGTGTALGDPIEVAALNQVFGQGGWRRDSCALGSVKTNIGHLGAAAGAAGLIKTALALHHRAIPASLHFASPNPRIEFSSGPFRVNGRLAPWEAGGGPRRAGVSSFGFGGTNAHAVLAEAPAPAASGPSRDRQLVVVSGRTPAAVDAAVAALAGHLRQHPDVPVADAIHTLRVGRGVHPHRWALVCGQREAAELLEAPERARPVRGTAMRAPEVAFLLPGQGAQHSGMTRGLYETEPGFRAVVDRCAELLRPELGLDLRTVLYPDGPATAELEASLDDTALTQPALFTVEYALARLLEEWGVGPRALLGHSLGEYVAACIAGVFELEDALRLVAVRGRLMRRLPQGAMLAVRAEPDAVERLLGPDLTIAAVNGPRSVTVSGPIPAIDELAAALELRDVPATRLRTSRAFHSPMMDPILVEFEDAVRQARPRPPRVPFVSNLTGAYVTGDEVTGSAYWSAQLRRPVRFWAGLTELAKAPGRVLVEVGPGRTLTGLARRLPGGDAPCVPTLPGAPDDDGADGETLLRALGRLWTLGVEVDWERFAAGERRARVSLPGHPLAGRRHWVDQPGGGAGAAAPDHGRLPLEGWFSVPAWREAPLSPAAPTGGRPAGVWLLFEDELGLLAEVGSRLSRDGHTVVRVRPGASFAAGADGYRVDPARLEDYEALVDRLAADSLLPGGIVHAWSVGAAATEPELDGEAIAAAHRRGFASLLHLAQAWASRQLGGTALTVLTSDAQAVVGDDLRSPGGATVAGVCRVLPAEMPGIGCRHVDVSLRPSAAVRTGTLADQVLTELVAPAEDETVALRGGRRWVRSFVPVELPPAPDAGNRLRQRGVYLITGGTGGIGLTLGRELARRLRARVVLTARSTFPERDRWAEWLAEHPAADRVATQIRAVEEMEALGGEVLVLSADAADHGAMLRARAAILERFGALHGIVHAAGLAGGGLIAVKTADEVDRVMAPKVTGGAVLAAVFGDLPLDFVALCSSITAVAGGLGQVDYCGANAFLDALAHTSAFGATPVVSVDWSTWLEAGMAVDTGAPQAFSQLRRGVSWTTMDHPLLSRMETRGGGEQTICSGLVGPAHDWVLDEHRLDGTPVLPGTAYLELARAAFERAVGPGPVRLDEVEFVRPLAVPDGGRREVRVVLDRRDAGAEFRVESRDPPGRSTWQEHARGAISRAGGGEPPRHDLAAIQRRCARPAGAGGSGLVAFGGRWGSLRSVHAGDGEAVAYLEAGEQVRAELDAMPLHPALLDEATTIGDARELGMDASRLPVGWGRLTVWSRLPGRLYSHLRQGRVEPGGAVAWDLVLMDEAGREVAEVRDLRLREVGPSALAAADETALPPAGRDGAEGIEPAEGAEAFFRVVAWAPASQVVVSPTTLATVVRRARTLTATEVERQLRDVSVADAPAPASDDGAAEPAGAPRTEAERVLVELWRELLGTDGFGIEDDFFELGGNSLVAVQLVSRIRAKLGARLPLRAIFECNTIAALAGAVERAG